MFSVSCSDGERSGAVHNSNDGDVVISDSGNSDPVDHENGNLKSDDDDSENEKSEDHISSDDEIQEPDDNPDQEEQDLVCQDGEIRNTQTGDCVFGDVCSESGSKLRQWELCENNHWQKREEQLSCTRETDGSGCGSNKVCSSGQCVEGEAYCATNGDIRNNQTGDCNYSAVCSETGTKLNSWELCENNRWQEKEDILSCSRETDDLSCGSNMVCADGSCVEGDAYCITEGDMRNDETSDCGYDNICEEIGSSLHKWELCRNNKWEKKEEQIACKRETDEISCGTDKVCRNESCVDNNVIGFVTGLDITEVAFYQSLKIPVMRDGAVLNSNVSPIKGKSGVFRIFVKRTDSWTPRYVTAELRMEIGGEVYSFWQRTFVDFDSTESDISSTINVDIPAGYLPETLKFQVKLTEVDTQVHQGSTGRAFWPENSMHSIDGENPGGPLEIVVVPITNNGRTPNINTEWIGNFRTAFYEQYPASDVVVTVGETLIWNQVVSSNGYGWEQLLNQVTETRPTTGEDKKKYYYGVFTPADSFYSYCLNGCVAGLGWVVEDYSLSIASYRTAIGLFFDDTDYFDPAETMIHEVGHNHGRGHSPCGSADGIDPDYPHGGASIGVWGYNLTDKAMIDPGTTKDFMSYCSPTWVSDYTYNALLDRIQDVAAMSTRTRTYEQDLRRISLYSDGSLEIGTVTKGTLVPGGSTIDIELLDEMKSIVETVQAQFIQLSSLPGGSLLFPEPDSSIRFIRVEGYGTVELIR